MRKLTAAFLLAALAHVAFATDLYWPRKIDISYHFNVDGGDASTTVECATSRYLSGDLYWNYYTTRFSVAYKRCQVDYFGGGSCRVVIEFERGEYYTIVASFDSSGEATVYKASNAGTQWVQVKFYDCVPCSVSNATGAGVTFGGRTVTAATQALPAQRDPAYSITRATGDTRKMIFYLRNNDTGGMTQLSTGGTLSGIYQGSYTVCARVLDNFPTFIFNDMAGDGLSLLYGTSDQLLYQAVTVKLMTEWVFVQEDYGSPQAYVNDECVCEQHSTAHIIDYEMVSNDNWTFDSENSTLSVEFTMSIVVTTTEEVTGGPCEYRVWVGSASTYDEGTIKAAISGDNTTVARFRFTYNLLTGAKTLAVVN